MFNVMFDELKEVKCFKRCTLRSEILPNISRSKRNQTMKFGQLVDYDIRNIFLEK